MVSPVVFGLWLFSGTLLGGDGGDCRYSAAQAARTLQAVERQWPLRPSADPVTAYVQALGERLLRVTVGSGRVSWHAHVLRNLTPSAFALGRGHFVVSDGLLALVRDEAQLAAVLAHEIAHEQLGHFCRDPGSRTRRFRLGSLVQDFDLSLEREADASAVNRLAAAKYDPGAMHAVLSCLRRRSGASAAELDARIIALQPSRPSPERSRRADEVEFERIRALVLDDLGEAIAPCR